MSSENMCEINLLTSSQLAPFVRLLAGLTTSTPFISFLIPLSLGPPTSIKDVISCLFRPRLYSVQGSDHSIKYQCLVLLEGFALLQFLPSFDYVS